MYVLITPVKDEEAYLYEVAGSVVKQTMRPELWVIVDDGSTDKTPEIINSLTNRYGWIKVLTLPLHDRDIKYHYSYVCKQGFDCALKCCEEYNIHYEYIGLLDADTVLVRNYFEQLLNEFKNDSALGIASGGIYYYKDNKLKWERFNENLPVGTGRLWRKECFFDTNGYIIEVSPDTISNVKALLRGWKIRQFKDIVCIQTRYTSSAEGLWKGYKINGYMSYYLNKHPALVALNFVYFIFKKPYYISIAYLYGYSTSIFKRNNKIADEEIRDYFWRERLREYRLMFINYVKSKFL